METYAAPRSTGADAGGGAAIVILAVVAHADDETLGMGGTIARLSAEGHEVHVMVLTDGVTSRYDDPISADHATIRARREQCVAACALLGAPIVHQYDYLDQRLDCSPQLNVTKDISLLIENLKPDVVYTHHGGDLNQDHRIVYHSVMIATRPVPGCPVREVYTFEIPSSTEWAFGGEQFRPNVFVDISGYLKDKLSAFACYATEIRESPHPRSLDALRARAQYWGSVVGVDVAEAFVLVRSVRT